MGGGRTGGENQRKVIVRSTFARHQDGEQRVKSALLTCVIFVVQQYHGKIRQKRGGGKSERRKKAYPTYRTFASTYLSAWCGTMFIPGVKLNLLLEVLHQAAGDAQALSNRHRLGALSPGAIGLQVQEALRSLSR